MPRPAENNSEASAGAQSPSAGVQSSSPKYELMAFVSHMGTSTACGHYVAHVKNTKKDSGETDWIIFNDNKVAFSVKPPRDLAYIYFYRQITQ